MGVEDPLVRNTLKGLVKRAIPEISLQTRKKVDCQAWSKEEVRDYILQCGEFCSELADALFKKGIPGYALSTTPPEDILSYYADHFSIITFETSYVSFLSGGDGRQTGSH